MSYIYFLLLLTDKSKTFLIFARYRKVAQVHRIVCIDIKFTNKNTNKPTHTHSLTAFIFTLTNTIRCLLLQKSRIQCMFLYKTSEISTYVYIIYTILMAYAYVCVYTHSKLVDLFSVPKIRLCGLVSTCFSIGNKNRFVLRKKMAKI